jgi:hypothetical protein
VFTWRYFAPPPDSLPPDGGFFPESAAPESLPEVAGLALSNDRVSVVEADSDFLFSDDLVSDEPVDFFSSFLLSPDFFVSPPGAGCRSPSAGAGRRWVR